MIVSLTRRQALAAALLPALAACTRKVPPRPAPVDPDVALRAAAVARERALLAGYDALTTSSPTLAGTGTLSARVAAVRAEHAAHLAALLAAPSPSASLPSSPSPSPAVSPVASSLPGLVRAERATAQQHAAAALAASRPLAQLLASLAASEAAHPVALS